MSKEIKFGDIKIDDNSLYVTKEISIKGKDIVTPIKSVDLSKIPPYFSLKEDIKGINEIHRKFLEKRQYYREGSSRKGVRRYSASDLAQNSQLQSQFNYRLNATFKKADQDKQVSITLAEYDGINYPTGKTLGFILDTIYEYSDISTLPIITGVRNRISNEEEFNKYVSFLKESIEIIEEFNNQPIMGIVPPITYFISDLIEFYVENGINAFCFDFDGKNPITMRQTIRGFLRALKKNKLLEESFIHSINVNAGRFIKEAEIIGAKDVLSFGLGFDCIGDKHKPPKGPKDFYDRLKDSTERRFRIFRKADYGYYRVEPSNVKDILPIDSSFSASTFSSGEVQPFVIQRLFNTEQLGLEAVTLRGIIKEEEPTKYLSSKKYVEKEDFKKIIKMKEDVSK